MHQFPFLSFITLASATIFRLTVFAPGTTIHGADIDASANGFYLGLKDPATYCPVGEGCPAVQGTLVNDDMSAMAVEVPGGQAIYIVSNGQVKYTQAHSAYIPPGSLLGGWVNTTVVSNCASDMKVLDLLAAERSDLGGFWLCPRVQKYMEGTGASYQLYTRTMQFNATNCIQAIGLMQHPTAARYGAWQYT